MSNTTKITFIAFILVVAIGIVVYLLRADQLTGPAEDTTTSGQVLEGEVEDTSSQLPTTPEPPVAVEPEQPADAPTSDGPLAGTAWNWILTTTGADDAVLTQAPLPSPFVLRFNDDANMSSATDCNQMGGGYDVLGDSIMFGPMYSTKMYCEGSMETVYATQLSQALAFEVEGDVLYLMLADNAGTMRFSRVRE
jgi:heat shock protein HslJ